MDTWASSNRIAIYQWRIQMSCKALQEDVFLAGLEIPGFFPTLRFNKAVQKASLISMKISSRGILSAD
jgi:hypothetical protein